MGHPCVSGEAFWHLASVAAAHARGRTAAVIAASKLLLIKAKPKGV